MSGDDLQDKVAKLPTWVRQLIEQLRKEAEPNNAELRHARAEVEAARRREKVVGERCEMMTHLMTCAAAGGHETAAAYVKWAAEQYLSDSEEDEQLREQNAALLAACKRLVAELTAGGTGLGLQEAVAEAQRTIAEAKGA